MNGKRSNRIDSIRQRVARMQVACRESSGRHRTCGKVYLRIYFKEYNWVSPSLSFGAAFRISVIRVTTKLRRIAMLNLAIYITDGIGVP